MLDITSKYTVVIGRVTYTHNDNINVRNISW